MAEADLSSIPTEQLLQMALGRTVTAKEDAIDRSAKAALVPTPLERFGRGQADFYEGAKQKFLNWTNPEEAKRLTQSVNEDLNNYERGRGFDPMAGSVVAPDRKGPGIDWLRFAGNATTPPAAIPGGGTSAVGRSALGALSGITQGYANFNPVNTESSNLISAGVGGGAGAAANLVLPPLINAGIKGAQSAGNAVMQGGRSFALNLAPQNQITNNLRVTLQQQGIDFDRLSTAAQQSIIQSAREQLSATGTLNAEQLARRADIEAIAGPGMGTRAQITRDPALWTQERNLQKTEMNLPAIQRGEQPGITNRYQAQDAASRQFANGVLDTLHGGTPPAQRAATGFQASERAAQVLQARADELQQAVGEAYTIARNTVGAQANLPRERFAGRAMEILDTFEDVMPSPIVRRLQEFGIERMGMTQPKKAFTVQEGDELLKLINKRYGSADQSTREALNELRGALKQSVEALGEGGNASAQAFRQAWGQASARFRELEQPGVRNLLNERTDPSRFLENKVLKGNPNDLTALRDTIIRGNGGQAAWNDLRGQAWQWAIDKATQGGRNPLSGAQLDNALRQIGDDRLRILFTPQELAQIQTLRRGSLAMTHEPGFAAPNRSNTTPSLVGQLLQLGNRIPFANVVTKPLQEQLEASTTQNLINQTLSGQGANTAARDAAQAAARQRITGILAGNRSAYPALLAPALLQQER